MSTIIRAPAVGHGDTNVTVVATNLSRFTNPATGQVFQTEVGGLTIASPLVGDPALGTINPNAVGLYSNNSQLLIDRDYFIDAGNGIWLPLPARARWPRRSRTTGSLATSTASSCQDARLEQRGNHDERHQQHVRLQHERVAGDE